MNRGQIRQRVLVSLREDSSPLRRFSDNELNLYIDDGYVDIAERTGVVVRTTTIDVPQGEHFVPLPSDCLYPLAVKDDTSEFPIDPATVDWVDSVDSTWIRRVRSRPWVYAAWGLKEIMLYPAYNVPGTINIQMAVIPDSPSLPADSSVPDMPDEYHQALVHYGHAQALLKDADGPRLGRASRQMGYYAEMIGEVETYANSRHEGIKTAVYGTRLRTPARLEIG
jgi:hypothetical protein